MKDRSIELIDTVVVEIRGDFDLCRAFNDWQLAELRRTDIDDSVKVYSLGGYGGSGMSNHYAVFPARFKAQLAAFFDEYEARRGA